MISHIEIEKRWLMIGSLNLEEVLRENHVSYELQHITQIYLCSEHTERVRKIDFPNGSITYIYTLKKSTENGIGVYETESEISEAQFNSLLERANILAQTIIKDRYTFYLDDFKYEVDQFISPTNYIIMEVELEDMNVNPPIPKFLNNFIEITGNKSLSNHKMAKSTKLFTESANKILMSIL